MHFISLTLAAKGGGTVFLNAEKISEILPQATVRGKKYTRVVFDFEVDGDYAYTDVVETPDEIMQVC